MTNPRRRFRFGVNPHDAASGPAWRELARKAEDLGYATLLLPDHANPQFGPFAGLAMAAASTTTLRIGTQVLSNDFRNPVLTAKELATLDVMSEGRLDWGMGAGWLPSDFTGTGIALDAPAVRLDRLIESVGVMKRLFSGEPVEHHGTHYDFGPVTGHPVPVQQPHPPLLIGGARQRILRFAGREADIVSISPGLAARRFGQYPASTTVENNADRQVGWVREGAGDRFDDVELSAVIMPARITDRPTDVAAQICDNFGLTADELLRSPHILLGSVDEMCDLLRARRERWGISNWVVPWRQAEAFAPVVSRLTGT